MPPNHYIDVGLKIPDCGEGVLLRIEPQGLSRQVFKLSVTEAKELARGLDLMADLHDKLRKEKP